MRFPLRIHRNFYFALLFCCTAWLAFGLTQLTWRADAAAQGYGGQGASDSIWQSIGVTQAEGAIGQARAFQLNPGALAAALNRAPQESHTPLNNSPALLTLPLPDGSFERFRIEESPLLEPALAAKFPEIKTYRAQGVDDPSATARLDWSPRGFHALILKSAGAVSVQPARTDDTATYISYASQDLTADAQDLICSVGEKEQAGARANSLSAPAAAVGSTLRVYRVAIATTVEYTNQANLGGGSVANTLASLATWLSGVNAILEKEVAVRLVLVANNAAVIFMAEPDGFTNSSQSTMLDEVPGVLSANIGSANFDIGHVLGTTGSGSGGIAGLGVICDNSASGAGQAKARGATRVSGPAGQSGQLGVLAHEFGHQLGASHTFNVIEASGNCAAGNRNGSTAYEVASGSTLMSYGGICLTNNLAGKEFRLHAGSFAQITAELAGATCNMANWIATGNNVPTINAGADYTIPAQTPFALTATGSDADAADVPNLTYTWDQIDAGGALYFNPPYGDLPVDPPTTTRPLFRSYPPTSNPTRLFPSLTYILNNANVPPATVNGAIPGENLPSVTRTMNFRATIRDNRSGGGGVNEDTAVIMVNAATGPFAVTSPNGGNNVTGGTGFNVTWNVAGTNGAPINTANVKISLSTDGGNTFPVVLAASTPNDGSQSVIFPNGIVSTTARVKIEAIGNIYFDISDGNFNLTPGDGCPAFSGLNPVITNTGGQVVLTGFNFTGVTAVNFTGANVNCPSANCTVNSNTQITLIVPGGAATGPLTIVKAGCTNVQTATLTICPNPPATLTYDGGFGSNCSGMGAGAYYVVRITPAAYPATLSTVLIQFSNFQGIAPGTAFTVVAAPHTSGSTNINGVSFQTVSATVGTLGTFTNYAITPITINSGDFVVGFSFPTNACAGLHDNTPTANRSYSSNDGANFSAFAGDLLIRAQVFTGNCAGAANTAPTFTPAAALTRQQGSPAGAAVTVGTVTDAQTPAGNLTVTQIAGGTATGITVTGITNTSGTITAQVSASCTATPGTVRFQVSDGGLTGTGDLQVNLTANTPPVLSYSSPQTVAAGGALIVNPATSPSDNGSVNSIVLQSQGTYTGTISVNNTTGVVSISNAGPVGSHTITVRATDNCGAVTDATFTLNVNNTAPVFTPAAAISRQQGSPAGAAITVGTVSDAQTSAGNLTVTQIAGGTATGITVTGITNTNGTITAQVSASCTATSGTVRFQVSDGNLTSTGDLQVNVPVNTAPTLSYSSPQTIGAGGSLTVNPATGPSDNGSIATIVVQSPGTYTGTISVNNTTGVVTISNAAPVGSHTITIRATDNCGAQTNASFTLNVNNTAPTFTPVVALTRQQASPAGAAVTVGTVADATTPAGNLTVTQIAGGTATGITVTGITNTNGTITAMVSASCTATSGTVRFQVSDGNLTGTGDLQVNVTSNSPPTLAYANANVTAGGAITVSPATGPTDNGTINSIVLQAQGTYTGTISVNNTTGVVSISNASPAGNHTITVRATDNCGAQTNASFTLSVGVTCPTITVNPSNPTLPTGRAGTAYSQTFTQTGGVGAVNFTNSAGTLPTGLNLSTTGVLSGTTNTFGTFNFTVRATDSNNCIGERAYTLTIHPPCTTITINPATLPNGTVGTAYNQTLTATGGTAPYTFAVTAGALPGGLTLANGGGLTGTPSATGTFNFTVTATDNTGCTGTRAYTININAASSGLMFYPLAAPVRLLDTRPGASANACSQPNQPITGQTSRTQPGRNICTIPANAAALTGNVTTVLSGGGFLTLYPSDAAQPTVASTNYGVNEIINNVFTVGLGADGAFKIFANNTTDVVVDVTGYYAPPATGGLYFHPLPAPVRLLETRAGLTGCVMPGAPLSANTESTQQAISACTGIPAAARAIVGNATTVNPLAGGFLTLFPADAARPLVASSNYNAGQIVNGPFSVGLTTSGQFKIYTTATTDLVVDVLGYYSSEANDVHGAGLLFYPLPRPVRLLETRPGLQVGCFKPGVPLAAGSETLQTARGVCDGVTIPANALGVVGNATVVFPVAQGFLTLWPSTAARPLVATSNYNAGDVGNRHFIVGVGNADGAFKIYTHATTDLVIDLSGYFAP